MNDTEKTIVVTAVTQVKTNKKGGKFISVKDESDTWWYVGEAKLFPLFKKGVTRECRVNRDNDFARIVDVMSDELGVKSRYIEPQVANNAQLDRMEQKLDDMANEIEELKKMVNPL